VRRHLGGAEPRGDLGTTHAGQLEPRRAVVRDPAGERLVDGRGEREPRRARLSDFGIVKALGDQLLGRTGNTYIGSARPDIVGSFPKDQGQAHMTGNLPRYFREGTYQIVSDPQCDAVTSSQGTRTACTLRAVADAQGGIILRHAQPGTLGTLGSNWLRGPGRFGFDLSASKTVRISETKSFQLRVDAHNVLNKPLLGNPNLNMNSADFGQIPASQVFGGRQFQALLRVSF